MGIAYFTQEDCQMRLNRTLCRYKGEPVYVEVYNEDPLNTVRLTPIPYDAKKRRSLRVPTTDPDFVHRSPELGYVNYPRGGEKQDCYYYARSPKRRQQQGLSAGNVDVLNEHGPSFSDIWMTDAFRNLIVNIYPKYEQALKSVLDGDVKGVAFHRHVCIRRIDGHNVSLFFKERMVAMYHPRMGCFNFLPAVRDGSYLNAFLNRIGVQL